MADNEPPAALLTDSQRDLLRGESDLTARGERAARSRIRDRFRATFEDLRLLFGSGAPEQKVDIKKVLEDVDAGRVWPLPALLFMWAREHPMLIDAGDFEDAVSLVDTDISPETRTERITASFDSQVEAGVRAALELSDFDHVPEDVENELTVSLGKPIDEMTEAELANLPRRTLDLLFRKGDLDDAEYARVMRLKLDSEETSNGNDGI